MKFGIGVLYKNSSNKREFRENRLSDVHTLLTGVMNFYPSFPYLLTDFGEIRYRPS